MTYIDEKTSLLSFFLLTIEQTMIAFPRMTPVSKRQSAFLMDAQDPCPPEGISLRFSFFATLASAVVAFFYLKNRNQSPSSSRSPFPFPSFTFHTYA